MYADQNSNVYFHSKDAVFLQATSLSFFRSHGRAFKSILHVSSSLFLKHFIYDFWLCFSLVVESRSYSLVEVRGLLIVVALLLWSMGSRTWGFSSCGFLSLEHRLSSCSAACGIFQYQGSNLCLLHWLADSLPLSHLGSPSLIEKKFFLQGPTVYHQRRQGHPTPVLLPGKSHGQRSLVGCSPWGR